MHQIVKALPRFGTARETGLTKDPVRNGRRRCWVYGIRHKHTFWVWEGERTFLSHIPDDAMICCAFIESMAKHGTILYSASSVMMW